MRAARNALAERNGLEDRHAGRIEKLLVAVRDAISVCVIACPTIDATESGAFRGHRFRLQNVLRFMPKP